MHGYIVSMMKKCRYYTEHAHMVADNCKLSITARSSHGLPCADCVYRKQAHLGSGVAVLGPAVDAASLLAHHGVLLLQTEPGLGGLDLVVDDLAQLGTGVGGVGLAIGGEDLAHHQHVGSAADGVNNNADGPAIHNQYVSTSSHH